MFSIISQRKESIKNDLLSGLTVALALVPEAVAFAILAHLNPLTGLYAAFTIGLIASIVGGRPGMISGATGAIAVVVGSLVLAHGPEYLFAAVIMMGGIQIAFGIFKLGKFIRLVPHPVFLGFVNGLALVILIAQFEHFKVEDTIDSAAPQIVAEHKITHEKMNLDKSSGGINTSYTLENLKPSTTYNISIESKNADNKESAFSFEEDFTTPENKKHSWITGTPLVIMIILIILTMLIIQFLPRYTKAIPSTLAAIVVGTLLVYGLSLETRTVADIASIKGGLPPFHLPEIALSWEAFKIVFPYALMMALVGLIESLLTLNLVDDLTETTGHPNRECIGQGVANTVTGMFSGMGGCAMVGQSIINIKSGGRGRLSGISASIFLLIFILYASELIETIPIAVLVGVMFMVVIGTFEWGSLRLLGKIPLYDWLIIVAVTAITVLTDNLAYAVIAGVILSALGFAWEHAKEIYAKTHIDSDGNKVYQIHGPLFFASIKNFQDLFTPREDTDSVIVDFENSRITDHSAIEALDKLAERYDRAGKKIHIKHLSNECRLLLKKAGPSVEVNLLEDPEYHVAADNVADKMKS